MQRGRVDMHFCSGGSRNSPFVDRYTNCRGSTRVTTIDVMLGWNWVSYKRYFDGTLRSWVG